MKAHTAYQPLVTHKLRTILADKTHRSDLNFDDRHSHLQKQHVQDLP